MPARPAVGTGVVHARYIGGRMEELDSRFRGVGLPWIG